jgi:3-hydroxymyristoyl/3-hydroxydecanoyl-(acyl carrier protein) dehydratase
VSQAGTGPGHPSSQEPLERYLRGISITDTSANQARCDGTVRDDFRGFEGHFPDNALLAGAFQLEMLAVLARHVVPGGWKPVAVEHARFRRMIRPGDRVALEASVRTVDGRSATVKANLFSGPDRACEATLIFAPQ